MRLSAQATIDLENRYPNVGTIMFWRVDDSGKPLQLLGFWSIPSYVCSGDSGGAIFLNVSPDKNSPDDELVANVSDGGRDCRRQNNNNRLDTSGIQNWIDDTIGSDAAGTK